jgi:hypothetical protein
MHIHHLEWLLVWHPLRAISYFTVLMETEMSKKSILNDARHKILCAYSIALSG